jgi:hypothetical protein
LQELVGTRVAFILGQEITIGALLVSFASHNDIQEETPFRMTLKSRGHLRREGRRD